MALIDDLMDARSIETSLADVEGPAGGDTDELSPDAQHSWTPWWE